MSEWALAIILVLIAGTTAAFIWVAMKLGNGGGSKQKQLSDDVAKKAAEDVDHIFNDEFREELRNRGRMHFEKIIGENAMFLQQDLRLTTSQLNEYMKQEISRTLKEEFSKYQESITDAKQLAIEAIEKTQATIDENREILKQNLQRELEAEKAQVIKRFEENMADIINHYLLAAIGDQIDLSNQLDYILADLEEHKQAIIEDVKSGA